MQKRTLCPLILAAVWCLGPRPAHAQKLVEWLEGSVGIKVIGVGHVLLAPDHVTGGDTNWLFSDTRGGYGIGSELYGELRFIRYVGLELGLMMTRNKVWEETKHADGLLKVEEGYAWTEMRLSMLLEGHLPLGLVRLGLCFGPEIAFSMNGNTWFRSTKGNIETYDSSGDLRKMLSALRATGGTDVLLTAGFSLSFDVWRLTIPLDFRYSYNLSDDRDYGRRVRFDPPLSAAANLSNLKRISLPARSTHMGSLLFGVAYNFK